MVEMNRQIEVTCNDSVETMQVGKKFGDLVKPGLVIVLVGDVGAGKTTFVKGLAKGLNITEDITSPTFNIKNEYEGRLKLAHLDLYRLNEPGLIVEEIKDAISAGDSVIVIEWAEDISDMLPEDHLKIEFKTTGENSRKLRIDLPDGLELNK